MNVQTDYDAAKAFTSILARAGVGTIPYIGQLILEAVDAHQQQRLNQQVAAITATVQSLQASQQEILKNTTSDKINSAVYGISELIFTELAKASNERKSEFYRSALINSLLRAQETNFDLAEHFLQLLSLVTNFELNKLIQIKLTGPISGSVVTLDDLSYHSLNRLIELGLVDKKGGLTQAFYKDGIVDVASKDYTLSSFGVQFVEFIRIERQK